MAKTKLTVATEFGTFSRTTARTYTHLIITTGNTFYAKRNLGWKLEDVKKAGAEVSEWLKTSLVSAQESVALMEKRATEGNYSALGWCGNLGLAQKAAAKANKDGFDNVKIIAVDTGAVVR